MPSSTCRPAWNWRPCAQRRHRSRVSSRSRASCWRELQLGRELLAIGQPLQEIRGEQGVEQVHMRAQIAREPGCSAHQVGEQAQQLRIGAQQREQLHARGQAGQELVEQAERRVAVRLVVQRVEERRHQLGQELAGAGRARGADVAVVPGANPGRDRRRVAKPHAGQRRQRVGIVVRAGEDEARPAAEVGLALEQGGVVALDREQRLAHACLQLRRVGEAGEGGEPLEIGLALGQGLGLPVRHHLQAVLELAQEAVGGDQLLGGRGLDPAPPRRALPGRRRSAASAAPARARPGSAAGSGRRTRSRECRPGRP